MHGLTRGTPEIKSVGAVTFGPDDVLFVADTLGAAVFAIDMAYVDGTLYVAGMSNEEFSSNLRRFPFPFGDEMSHNSLEIFHVSHGVYETAAPINTFVPYGDGRILASYTCTPLVTFSIGDL